MSPNQIHLSRRWPTAIDLFCGCGGVTAGLKAARFKVIAAVDSDPLACRTYRSNHPSVRLIERDITIIDPWSLRENLLKDANLDLLVVCAPCQPFSSHQRYVAEDDRISLILQAIRFANALQPRLILFENVPGLAGPRFQKLREKLVTSLQGQGYHFGMTKRLDAADFGVPQRRVRCIMLASKDHITPELPQRTVEGRQSTVRTAIEDLRPLNSGEADPNDELHFARHHRSMALERLKYIPRDGGSRDSLPNRLQLECHKGHKGHPDVYGRMTWDAVAPTLTTGCTDLTRGRFGHPRDDRAVTLREAARLQTFPDNYRFLGNSKEIATQIGNAVPIRLIEKLAPTLKSLLKT